MQFKQCQNTTAYSNDIYDICILYIIYILSIYYIYIYIYKEKLQQEIIFVGVSFLRKRLQVGVLHATVLKRDSRTGIYFCVNFAQALLRIHIAENFQKLFMQKAASIVFLKFHTFLCKSNKTIKTKHFRN